MKKGFIYCLIFLIPFLTFSQVSVSFEYGVFGYIGTSPQKLLSPTYSSSPTLDIKFIKFYQTQESEFKNQNELEALGYPVDTNAQGNDVPGRIQFIFNDFSTLDVPAYMVWREGANPLTGFGVLFNPGTANPPTAIATITYNLNSELGIVDGDVQGVSTNLWLKIPSGSTN